MNILLVDDCEIMRSILKVTLSKHKDAKDFTFFRAENGLCAYDIIKANKIDIMFLDWNMPMMTGDELVTELRKDDRHQNIKVIMATTEGSKEKILTMAKKGIHGYILKPFNQQSVTNAFNAVYSKREISLT